MPDAWGARLGQPLRAWKQQVLAYFNTGVFDGATEAINLIIEKIRRRPTTSATSATTGSEYGSPPSGHTPTGHGPPMPDSEEPV